MGILKKVAACAPLLLAVAGCTIATPICGIRPTYPEVRYAMPQGRVANVDVDSVQPTLRWEAWPSDEMRENDKGGMLDRVSSVLYDLRIWIAAPGKEVRLVYEQEGISGTEHQIARPLEPATRHFWSVRARYQVDGREGHTIWSLSKYPWSWPAPDPGTLGFIPENNSFRFTTPEK
jgi:hypothetical protein